MILIKYLIVVLSFIFGCGGTKPVQLEGSIPSKTQEKQEQKVDEELHGLCKPCVNHKQCIHGGQEVIYSGMCIDNKLTDETFCTRSCFVAPCPNGFLCVQALPYEKDPSRTEEEDLALKIYSLQCIPELFDISCEDNLTPEGRTLSIEGY